MNHDASPTVLILGARGRFGLAAARAFARAGWRVLGQLRPGAEPAQVPGMDWLAADLADTEALAAAANGAAVVVHALNPAYTHKAWRAQVPLLMGQAIALARTLGATLMLPGNVYNYGRDMPALLREDTPQRPTMVKGHIRAEAERQLRQATLDGRMKAVVIRAGDFFGAGQGSVLDMVMVKQLRAGRVTYPNAQEVPTAWAYLPDLARAFVQVAQRQATLAAFETFHFPGYSLSRRDWLDALRDIAWEQGWLRADGRLTVSSVPWPLLRLAGLFVPELASVSEMRYLWFTPHALDGERLRALLGDVPHTPFPTALRAALRDLRMLDAPAEAGAAATAAPASATARQVPGALA